MRNDLTDITLVVDRSGSMESGRMEAENGINAFIADQRKQPGFANLTLVQFDTEYKFIHNGVCIHDIPKYKLRPRGMTALLDAVGRAINEVGARLEAIPERARPGCVIFVIVTDGHENASHEFTKDQIKEMIERQRSVYNWKFTFLGADEKAFDQAAGMGILRGSSACYNKSMSDEAYGAVSQSVCRLRACSMTGDNSGELSYSQEQREAMQ